MLHFAFQPFCLANKVNRAFSHDPSRTEAIVWSEYFKVRLIVEQVYQSVAEAKGLVVEMLFKDFD